MGYKKSRWEIKYDNYKNDREEIKQKMLNIRREQAELKEGPEYAAKKKELEELKKKSNEYNKIEQNETKIENILEYKKKLVEKNTELIKQKSEIDKKEQKLNKINANIEKNYGQIDKLLAKINGGKLSEEQKLEAHAKIDEYIAQINTATVDKEKLNTQLQNTGKEKLEQEIAKNDRLISKCDLIGANLLKGKDMDNIKARLSSFESQPNKALSDKKEKAENEKIEDKNSDKDQDTVEHEETVENKEIEEEQQEKAEDNVPKKITLIDKLRNRFPRIAGFIDKATDKVKNVFKKREKFSKDSIKDEVDNNTVEEIKEEIEKTTGEPVKEPETKAPEKKVKDIESAENEMLLQITEKGEKGFRDSIMVDKKQLLENMRKAKAKEYAEKYGGRYETQDGANLDNKEDEGR